ncbi:trigger factor [Phyllobacterium sp. 21LDTY02-6]|jgi:trigger factor|uniref:trigger factor n=1 Tax=unclassified Phyllobacterium TaxID=2638441 RepID=UPI0020207833|nr:MULTISPECIES: trigger factor [unclassified Phyllobacterium]MCO4316745.1 trigger factor [Phyllobacterium sp. 21LDTY02-6]MCX8281682.1 trigger factor [Phyllobacterium sp. 0TCS1.6C]MCX8294792.1 trigger factor [Phyllobacterium sp. 0TCS1.6A]
MQVTETLNEGLKREIKVVVPAKDLEAKLSERLQGASAKARINGFRPGKVPVSHLRKVYGKSFMAEVVNEILSDSSRTILSDRNEKSATQPEVVMTEDEKEAEKVLNGEADFEFSLNYEVLPEIELKDASKISVTREVVEVTDEEVEEQAKRIASSAQTFEPKKGKAESGDRVTMDYLGKVDGVPFDGGADTDATLVLGSGQFIPGFEDQLIGVKAGDEKEIKVTFPEQYQAAHLAGKDATFDIKVKEVGKPGEIVINDETAQSLGLENAERLRQLIREQIENQYKSFSRQKVKRQILDALDGEYKFESPQRLIDAEFNNIWSQITQDLQTAGKTFEDEETTEEEAREEYRKLAERRVRLGLVLSEIGNKAGVEVTEEELQRAVYDQVRQYPGQEKQIYDFFRNTPDAINGLRAPIFEEKVVDHLLESIKVTDKTVTKEELMADDETDTKAEAKKPAKKAAPKKAAKKKTDDEA